jgi:hypothetical protein
MRSWAAQRIPRDFDHSQPPLNLNPLLPFKTMWICNFSISVVVESFSEPETWSIGTWLMQENWLGGSLEILSMNGVRYYRLLWSTYDRAFCIPQKRCRKIWEHTYLPWSIMLWKVYHHYCIQNAIFCSLLIHKVCTTLLIIRTPFSMPYLTASPESRLATVGRETICRSRSTEKRQQIRGKDSMP